MAVGKTESLSLRNSGRGMTFATSKLGVYEGLRNKQLPGIDVISLLNPERPGSKADYQREPASHEPQDALSFKLERAQQNYVDPHAQEAAIHTSAGEGLVTNLMEKLEPEGRVFIATDVVYSLKLPDQQPEFMHKPVRGYQDLAAHDHAETKEKLYEYYTRGRFTARWLVGIGMGDGSKKAMGIITFFLKSPAFTRHTVDKFYDVNVNSGVQMVEAAQELQLDLEIHLPSGEIMVCNTDELRELAYRLIVQKLPTWPILETLYAGINEGQDETPNIVEFGAEHFTGLDAIDKPEDTSPPMGNGGDNDSINLAFPERPATSEHGSSSSDDIVQ